MRLGRKISACLICVAVWIARTPAHAQSPTSLAVTSAASPTAPQVVRGPVDAAEHYPSPQIEWAWTPEHDARARHVGLGHPLEGTSWLNRPYGAGWFVGGLVGDELIADRVSMHSDFFAGLRLGWDFDYFWGTEIRLGWSEIELTDSLQPPRPRPGDFFAADVNYLRYIWGDSQVRPFWSIGLGLTTFHFIDSNGIDYNESLVTIPLGVGLKYLPRPWLAVRMDLQDNITVAGGGLDSMQNFTFTVGAEVRLGGQPRSYWPWHPSKEIW